MSNIIETEAEKIKELLNETYLYKNPELLEDIRKTIRKNVPLLKRGNLLAYLYVTNPHFSAVAKNYSRGEAKSGEALGKQPEKRYPTQRPTGPKAAVEGTTSLYVGVGKMNRISPSGIIQFIANGSGLKDSDILSLSYRQNYSFIIVKNEHAQQIVEKMNGAVLKGRKIRVNYAKDTGASANNG